MQGGVNTQIDAIAKAIIDNNSNDFYTHLNALFKQTPLPDSIVQQWIGWTRTLINQGKYTLLLSALQQWRPHFELREPLENMFIKSPELEQALINNFQDYQTINIIKDMPEYSKIREKFFEKWYDEDNASALAMYSYDFYFSTATIYLDRFEMLKKALRDKKLDIVGEILRGFPADQDRFKVTLGDYNIPELIDIALKNNQFYFVIALRKMGEFSHFVKPDHLQTMKEKMFKDTGEKTKNLALRWPDDVPLDASLVVELYKKQDWKNLGIAISRASMFSAGNGEVFLEEAEFNDFTKALLTRYGREAIPLIEQLERSHQNQFEPWRDLLPAEAYFILENQKELYEKIQAYHLIPKDSEADLLLRLKALWDIQQLARKVISTEGVGKEQKVYLHNIVITCQNKAKYIGKLKKMDRKLTNRLFRLEHVQGQPLRVEGPLFPALGSTFNSEVLTDLDPYHRAIPEPLFEKWLQDVSDGKSKSNFWLWLENHPDVELKINEHYRMPKEILRGEFDAATGKMQKTLADGKKGMVPDGSYLYNIDRNGNLFIATGQFAMHHSHLIKDAVLSAGMIKFKDGLIIDIDNNSGHYMPNRSHLKGALKLLNLPKEAFSSEAVVRAHDGLSGQMVVLGSIKEFLAKANEAQERKDLLFKGPDQLGHSIQSDKIKGYDELLLDIIDNKSDLIHASFVGKVSEELEENGPGYWLCFGLPTNTHLESLALSGRYMVDENDFPPFLKALQENNSLKLLDVSDMSLTGNQCTSLKTVCEQKNIKLLLPDTAKKISPD